ncbi:unnamed protein product [marine sediment metagenome]|uniref:Uncharacterized protein n=1 Tax=marine sediment metagenome TaxID=412755 RepID=X1DIJ8_9ZZZZ
MTKKNVFRKGLVIAIIVCFVGAGVFPSISGSVIKKANFNDTQNQEFVPGEFYIWGGRICRKMNLFKFTRFYCN